MYQDFGAQEIGNTKRARLRLFVPDNTLDPQQYDRGAAPNIAQVHAIGDFQHHFGTLDWTPDAQFEMQQSQFTDPEDQQTKGWLYELTLAPLPDDFYQYKLHITYNSGATRVICDPCTRYGGVSDQNSGFVIGGPDRDTLPLADPRPLNELILYELMIDDFTAIIRGNLAPLTVVENTLDHLEQLGVNAIEFMPWTQWPGEDYDWGYEPQGYFAVAFAYTLNPTNEAEKLYLLKQLISTCHARGLHVILDSVFDHVTGSDAHRGFGYHWLWENPEDSPYTGAFAQGGYGIDLDFHNACTSDFAFDVCRYWIEEFAIDGLRFDFTSGLYDPENEGAHGLPILIARLRAWLDAQGKNNFPLILEHSWDYEAINVVNLVGATSCWLDPFRSTSRKYLSDRHVGSGIMRFLDSSRDFGAGRVPVTYIENHDHESFTLNAGGRDQWWRMQPYAIALLTAPGAPLIHNGQEFGSCYPMPEPFTESGPSDSQDPAVRRVVPRPLLWSECADDPGQALLPLYRRLIALRREHPGLTSPNFHPANWDERWTQPDANGFGIDEARQVVVYHRWGDVDNQTERFYIVLNFSPDDQPVDMTFPEDDGWIDLLSGWQPPVQNNHLRFIVHSNWGAIFYKKS